MVNIFLKSPNKKPYKQKESLEATKLTQITVETSHVDLDIKIHDEPLIDIVLETYEDGPELMTNCSNGTAVICVRKPVERTTFFREVPSCRLQILVPKDLVASWDIRLGSGDVSVEQVIIDSLCIKAGSGDLYITEVKANEVSLHTSSGDIVAHKNKLGRLQFESSSGDVEIETIHGDISGRANSGGIFVKNHQGEQMELGTSSGDMEIKNSVVGNAKFQASSGEIEMNHLVVGCASMKTSSGDMEVYGFSGEMRSSTNSGSIHVTPIEKFMLDLKAGSGDITIACGEEVSTTFDAKTGSGEIITNYPMRVYVKKENELSGVIGDGENQISVKTGSGEVILGA